MTNSNLNEMHEFKPQETSIQTGYIIKIHDLCEKTQSQGLSKSEICLNCSTFLLGIDSILSVVFENSITNRSLIIKVILVIAVILYIGYLLFRKMENIYLNTTIQSIVNMMPLTKDQAKKELDRAELVRDCMFKYYNKNFDSPQK